jgi:hypothetical protein
VNVTNELVKLIGAHSLLPNDALHVVTMQRYGITNIATKHFLYKRTCAKKEETLSFYEKDKPLLSLSGSRERGRSQQYRGCEAGPHHVLRKIYLDSFLFAGIGFGAHLFEDALNLLAVPTYQVSSSLSFCLSTSLLGFITSKFSPLPAFSNSSSSQTKTTFSPASFIISLNSITVDN